MRTRRQFLIQGVRGLGGWLIAPRIADAIQRRITEQNLPYLIPIHNPKERIVAEADDYGSGYSLGIELPEDWEPEKLTWGQYFENESIDPTDLNEVREHLVNQAPWAVVYEDDEQFSLPDLDELIDESLQEQHDEWTCTRHWSPEAQVYHYLSELPLGNTKRGDAPILGKLSFYDGVCPGNDSLLVTAQNLVTVSCLQQRLLDLGENVEIVIR